MGIPCDDLVLVQQGNLPGEPTVVTVNCPDKPGLGCDLCRIVLQFGLCITRADFSTDGRWCYIVLWVVPDSGFHEVDWERLKNRMLDVCPPCLVAFYLKYQPECSLRNSLYLLKLCSLDRKGLLHDVTKVLTELEFTIQRVKVMTTPDGGGVDLFFITDDMDLLHTKKRQDDTCNYLFSVLGEYCIGCELQLPGPEYESLQGFSSLPPALAEELFGCETPKKEANCDAKIKKPTVTVDNLMSPLHTLLQIQCADQKGILYDVLRISKDCNIQISYGRFFPSVKGVRNVDLFIQQADGKKIVDPKQQVALCSRLKEEMLHPLRVTISNRGPDTELLVANPVELSGKGRPRVFYDITSALKTLRVCIFSAQIGRHSTSENQWEVYRFLLDENCELQLASSRARSQIIDSVKRTLMGW